MDRVEEKRRRVLRALGTDDDALMEAIGELADGVIEELRASAGDPKIEPHVAKGYVCMSSGVDYFISELERCWEIGRGMRAGVGGEDL